VVIDGSSIYSPPRLFATYRDQLGQPYSRESTRAIAAALVELYVHDGYVKPEVTLDETQTSRGMLRLQLHEPQVTRVVFEGDGGKFDASLRNIGERLENTRPLRREDVAQSLRAMRADRRCCGHGHHPDAIQRFAMRFELVVQTDYSPVDGVVRMNNRGTDQVGPAFMLGQVFANGLLGGQEKIGLIFAAATDHDEYLGGGLYVDTPFGDGGTRGNALLFRSHSAPNEAPVNLEDEYVRERLTLRVSKPFRQSSAFLVERQPRLRGDDPDHRSRRRHRARRPAAHPRGVLRSTWRTGDTQWTANLQVRQGLDALGSGLHADDLVDDPRRADFIVMLMQGSASRRFAERWTGSAGCFRPEQWLRAARQRTLQDRRRSPGTRIRSRGDRRRQRHRRQDRPAPRTFDTGTFAGRLSAYGFYDIGAAWKQDAPGRESAATAGTGIAMQGAALTGYLEVATPAHGT
jgi:hemolysin activation/secretion protein